MLNVITLGISHQTAPIEIRESLSFTQPALASALRELCRYDNVEECVILSTCNRVEVYAVSPRADLCIEDIKTFISEFHNIQRESLTPYTYTLVGSPAIRHLFRVAASLDSMVVGEPQILGQVKEAYKIAHESGSSGFITNRLFHYAFSIAKRIRHHTKIGSQAVSIGYAAVELARRIFDDLPQRTTLLIGTGEMGELTAKHLKSAGIKELIIAGRTPNNALELATRLNGRAIKIEEVHYALRDVDVVITATGSSDFIIKKQHVTEALKLRKNEPMFMIDIAVPRDIDPRVEEVENIYLYDIDDLRGVLDENMKSRRERAAKAEEIAQQGVGNFEKWLESLKAVPTIISLKQRLETITTQEVDKALRKLGDCTERDKKIIESMAKGIIGKVLHSPITKLKSEASTSLGAFYSSSLKELFELDSKLELIEEEDDEAQG